MKVLFAVGSAALSERIASTYFTNYGEKLEYKNVFYFKAILEEVKRDNTYDRIVIAEQLEPMQNNVIDEIDKMLFNNLDSITDEIDDSTIIFICSDNRTRNDQLIGRLFNLGIFNVLIGDERHVDYLCKLIKEPRSKKEAKEYLNANPADDDLSMKQEDGVNERELISTCNYFDGLKTPEQYLQSFASVAEQYDNDEKSLVIIVAALTKKLKNGEEIFATLQADPRFSKYCEWRKDEPKEVPGKKQIKKGIFGLFKNKNNDNEQEKVVMHNEKDVNPISDYKGSIGETIGGVVGAAFTNKQDDSLKNQLKEQEAAQKKFEEENRLAKERQEREDKFKAQQEAYLKAQQEELLRKQQEEQLKAQQEELLRQQQEEQMKAQQEELLRQQQEEQMKAQQEELLRQQQEEQMKAQQEELLRKQQEDQRRAQQEELLRKQQEEQMKAQQEALRKQQEEQLKAQQEALRKQQAEQEALRRQQEEQLKAQQEELLRQQQEEQRKAEQEAQRRQEEERIRREQEEALNRQREELLRQQEEIRKQQEALMNNPTPVVGGGYTTGGITNTVTTTPAEEPEESHTGPLLQVPSDYKKIVAFVGTEKVGTTFLVNCVSTLLANQGVKTSILDMTKNRGLYWFYSEDTVDNVAEVSNCMTNLSTGKASPIRIGKNKNLKLYTTVPKGKEDNRKAYKHRTVVETARKDCNLLIIDCDFSTPIEYLEQAQEVYIVQDLDLLKTRETQEFLRILKQRHFDWSKLTVVFNNVVNSSKITTKKLIREGLTYYVDATNTYTEELERISRYTEIPLNPINYSVYIDAMDKGRIPYDNFTPEFKTAMDTLSKMVYGILGEKRKKSIFG